MMKKFESLNSKKFEKMDIDAMKKLKGGWQCEDTCDYRMSADGSYVDTTSSDGQSVAIDGRG